MKTTYISIVLVVLISILTLTFLHDPILHGAIAVLNGWNVTDYEKGILTGYTNVSMSPEQFENTPIIQVWLFYMAPALILFFGAALIIIMEPNKVIGVIGIILMFINLASLSPERLLTYSDSSQAMYYLISVGVNSLHAMLLHWGIFALALLTLAMIFYTMIEDDQKDAEGRVREVIT